MPPSDAVARVQPIDHFASAFVLEEFRQPGDGRHHFDADADERGAAKQHQLPQLAAEGGSDGETEYARMLAIMMVLRPRRSISKPPSRPKTPPDKAAIQSMRPPQARTGRLVGATPRFSSGSELRPSSANQPGELPSG